MFCSKQPHDPDHISEILSLTHRAHTLTRAVPCLHSCFYLAAVIVYCTLGFFIGWLMTWLHGFWMGGTTKVLWLRQLSPRHLNYFDRSQFVQGELRCDWLGLAAGTVGMPHKQHLMQETILMCFALIPGHTHKINFPSLNSVCIARGKLHKQTQILWF